MNSFSLYVWGSLCFTFVLKRYFSLSMKFWINIFFFSILNMVFHSLLANFISHSTSVVIIFVFLYLMFRCVLFCFFLLLMFLRVYHWFWVIWLWYILVWGFMFLIFVVPSHLFGWFFLCFRIVCLHMCGISTLLNNPGRLCLGVWSCLSVQLALLWYAISLVHHPTNSHHPNLLRFLALLPNTGVLQALHEVLLSALWPGSSRNGNKLGQS